MNYLEIAEKLRRVDKDIEDWEDNQTELPDIVVKTSRDVLYRIVSEFVESRCGNDPKWNEERFKFALNTKTCTRVNCTNFEYTDLSKQEGNVCGDCLCGDI